MGQIGNFFPTICFELRNFVMYEPDTYVVSLTAMILITLCWGSWVNARNAHLPLIEQ
jgi:hypothetical protein